MALTITEDFRYTAGGKQFRYVSVADDESTSTFTAASVGLSYCEYVGNIGMKFSSDIANGSILMQHMIATTDGLTIEMGVPANAATIKKYLLIGW
jgi:hypothetical protein